MGNGLSVLRFLSTLKLSHEFYEFTNFTNHRVYASIRKIRKFVEFVAQYQIAIIHKKIINLKNVRIYKKSLRD